MLLSPSESGKFIADKAEHVRIVEAGVRKCAEELERRVLAGELAPDTLFTKAEIQPQNADEEGLNWIFMADTLNFSFWTETDQPHYCVTYKGQTYSGYLSLCAAINRTLDKGVRLTSPEYFGTVTAEELNDHLMGDGGQPCPMIPERVACLHEVARVLADKYEGRFLRCLERCRGSAAALVHLVHTDFPCFKDVALYRGQPVSLLKRAQILVADIWAFFGGQGLGRFDDIDDAITMFADYRVPQSLLYFGALEYSPRLDEELRNPLSPPLVNGCQFEVEIRGCSIEAVTRIVRETNDRLRANGGQRTVNCILADYFLWGFRREKAAEIQQKAIPYHKVRSIYY